MQHPNLHTDIYSHERPLQWQQNYARVREWFNGRGNVPARQSEIIRGTGLMPNAWRAVSSKGKACFVKTPTLARKAETRTWRLTSDEYAPATAAAR